jgi:hypothetical protein
VRLSDSSAKMTGMCRSISAPNPLTKTPLKVVYLHSLTSKPDGVPCSTHYGLSAGMIPDLAKKLEKPKERETPFVQNYMNQKYTNELKLWIECYNKTWKKACQELAECFQNVEAFLVLPSSRTEMRQILIQSFLTAHADAINLSDLIDKPPGAALGSIKDVKAIMDQLTVNENLVPELLKIKSLLLVDDWFGTGSTMFAVQARIAALSGKEVARECAVPGIAQDEDWLKKREARMATLGTALLRDAGLSVL